MATCVCYGAVLVVKSIKHIVFLREISLVLLWFGLIRRYRGNCQNIHADIGRFITQWKTDACVCRMFFFYKPKYDPYAIFKRKFVRIFLPISLDLSFWCSKEPSHWKPSGFEVSLKCFFLITNNICFG